MARTKKGNSKKAGQIVATVLATVVGDIGMKKLNALDFMQPKADKKPILKGGINAAVTVASGFGALKVRNELAGAALTGIASAGAINTKDVAVTMVGDDNPVAGTIRGRNIFNVERTTENEGGKLS